MVRAYISRRVSNEHLKQRDDTDGQGCTWLRGCLEDPPKVDDKKEGSGFPNWTTVFIYTST